MTLLWVLALVPMGCRGQQQPGPAGVPAEPAVLATPLADASSPPGATAVDAGAALPVGADRGLQEAGRTRGTATAVAAGLAADRRVATARAARPDPAALGLALVPVASGLDEPVDLQAPPGASEGRIWAVEKGGRVQALSPEGAVTPWLDIAERVGSSGYEQGLLGLAFHPDFGRGSEGRFYVNYTDRNGDTVVAEYRAVSAAGPGDPGSERVLLRVPQPAANHNGGQLAFGPDGFLYIGLGDGGGAGDRYENAQDPQALLGKMLRLDVAGEPYAVPPDNPFAADAAFRPEIWAWGLRNPWRFSFDSATGDLYIADVGQAEWEEVNRQPADSPGGENYGWPLREGNHCYDAAEGADCEPAGGSVRPVAEYSHGAGGCSVTGGYVYRGRALPALVGAYVFGDFCSGRIWATWPAADGAWPMVELVDSEVSLSSFGQDGAGELYLADSSSGAVLQLVAADGSEPGYGAGEPSPTSAANRPVGDPSARTE